MSKVPSEMTRYMQLPATFRGEYSCSFVGSSIPRMCADTTSTLLDWVPSAGVGAFTVCRGRRLHVRLSGSAPSRTSVGVGAFTYVCRGRRLHVRLSGSAPSRTSAIAVVHCGPSS